MWGLGPLAVELGQLRVVRYRGTTQKPMDGFVVVIIVVIILIFLSYLWTPKCNIDQQKINYTEIQKARLRIPPTHQHNIIIQQRSNI